MALLSLKLCSACRASQALRFTKFWEQIIWRLVVGKLRQCNGSLGNEDTLRMRVMLFS